MRENLIEYYVSANPQNSEPNGLRGLGRKTGTENSMAMLSAITDGLKNFPIMLAGI